MLKRDAVLGGIAGEGQRPRRRRNDPAEAGPLAPPMVGWRFLLTVILVATCLGGLGLWRVNTVFRARDNEIEAHRLQELARARRDRTKSLEARVSQLQRGEILKTAAVEALGMTAPDPARMESVEITAASVDAWRRAAAEYQAQLLAKEEPR